MYNRKKAVTWAIVTFALNFIAYFWIAKWFGSTQPWFYATALILSISIHELGHAIVLELNGVKTSLVFAIIGAGVAPGEEFVKRERALDASTKSLMYLAGVIGNFVMIVICGILSALGIVSEDHGSRIINLNAGLIFWNLLPISIFDGGRFVLTFFESIKEDEEHEYVWGLSVISVAVVVAISMASGQFVATPIFLLLYGINQKAKTDDPKAYYRPGKLSSQGRFVWAGVWLAMLALGFSIQQSTPDFIPPWH